MKKKKKKERGGKNTRTSGGREKKGRDAPGDLVSRADCKNVRLTMEG